MREQIFDEKTRERFDQGAGAAADDGDDPVVELLVAHSGFDPILESGHPIVEPPVHIHDEKLAVAPLPFMDAMMTVNLDAAQKHVVKRDGFNGARRTIALFTDHVS